MKKINWILMGILLFQLIVLAFKPFSHKTFYASRTDLFKDLKSSDIALITVIENSTDNARVTIHKADKTWLVKNAFDFKADKTKIDEILLAVRKFHNVKEVSSNSKMFPSYELSDKNYRKELKLADKNGKVLADILIGKGLVGGTFIRVKGKNAVYRIDTSLDSILSSDPKDYFAKSEFAMPLASERKEVVLKFGGDTMKFVKVSDAKPKVVNGVPKTEPEKWKGAEISEAGLPDDWADATALSTFLDSLNNVYVDSVAGKGTDKKFGLEKPYIELTVKTDKTSLTIKVGNKLKPSEKDSPRYVVISGGSDKNKVFEGFVLSLNSYNYKEWEKRIKDFKKKDLKREEKTSDKDLSEKIPNMKIPQPKLNLKLPGIPVKKPKAVNPSAK